MRQKQITVLPDKLTESFVIGERVVVLLGKGVVDVFHSPVC